MLCVSALWGERIRGEYSLPSARGRKVKSKELRVKSKRKLQLFFIIISPKILTEDSNQKTENRKNLFPLEKVNAKYSISNAKLTMNCKLRKIRTVNKFQITPVKYLRKYLIEA
jgi:hypothetical protein